MADGQKTEKATPKRRRDERKKGHVFMSNDAVSVAVLLVSIGVLAISAPIALEQIERFFHLCFSMAGAEEGQELSDSGQMAVQFLKAMAWSVGPLLGASTVAGVAATFLQTKMLVAGEALLPKFSRINPLEGFKRLFSLRSLVEAFKGILKILVLLYLIYSFLSGVVDVFPKLMFTDVAVGGAYLKDLAVQMALRIAVAYTILAGADFLYQWWDYERQLRMTKQEIKEEYKQTEGDPQVKGKIKEVQRKMAQSRMMQQVPQADVVIRNPTHFAVALRYKLEKDAAPVVLAKGQDSLALRIVQVAEASKVAVVENVPLARALYASAEVGQEIPPELYNAVAEVLVYLYRLNGEK